MLKLPIFGSIRHMKRIGDDPAHRALRYRNEQRLAALKASNRLYEDKRESTPAWNCCSDNLQYQNQLNVIYGSSTYGYCPGSALGSILGANLFNNR